MNINMFDPKKRMHLQKIKEIKFIRRPPLLITNKSENNYNEIPADKDSFEKTIITTPNIDSSLGRLIQIINQIIDRNLPDINEMTIYNSEDLQIIKKENNNDYFQKICDNYPVINNNEVININSFNNINSDNLIGIKPDDMNISNENLLLKMNNLVKKISNRLEFVVNNSNMSDCKQILSNKKQITNLICSLILDKLDKSIV
jgi:hypothetical protein